MSEDKKGGAWGAAAPKAGPLSGEPVSIELQSVSKSFGGRRVVEPVSLFVPAGKRAALLGPSGCGKTTVLRLIAGLEKPDPGGRVFLGGSDVTGVPAERRGAGMVFQQFALFPHMTVEDNVAYGLRVRGAPRRERAEAAREMLELVKLPSFAKRGVGSLSGGQKQRVALARALAPGPRVLLLDEPLAALDANLRVSLREELEELLARLGITTVMVTHDQDEAMALGDLIIVMKDGRVEQTGSPAEIYNEPKTSFVAGFMGGSNHLLGSLDADCLRLPGEASIPRSALKNGFGAHESQAASLGGGRVSVFFRPDKPIVGEPAPGRMRGTVVSSRFVGRKTRLVVRVGDGEVIKLEHSGGGYSPGDMVGVEIPPEELRLFAPAAP
jgi:putative spermidine/putrescine transport system ATP-binding protein